MRLHQHAEDANPVNSAGSPLGLFLALRKVDPAKGRGLGSRRAAALMLGDPATLRQGDGLPAVRRMYNLYHPFDPVGYRCAPCHTAPLLTGF